MMTSGVENKNDTMGHAFKKKEGLAYLVSLSFDVIEPMFHPSSTEGGRLVAASEAAAAVAAGGG